IQEEGTVPFEPVKQEMAVAPSVDPDATPISLPAESSFWLLPQDERSRMMRDLETYRRELSGLLQAGHAGQFAIIRDDRIISVWATQEEALQVAADLFGLSPVFVKKIDPRDPERFCQLTPEPKS